MRIIYANMKIHLRSISFYFLVSLFDSICRCLRFYRSFMIYAIRLITRSTCYRSTWPFLLGSTVRTWARKRKLRAVLDERILYPS